MMTEDLPYWLALVRFRKFGPIRLSRLMNAFPSMREAFFASEESLGHLDIPLPVIQEFLATRPHLDPAAEFERLSREGVEAVTLTDERYPTLLKTIHDPPAILFLRGQLPDPLRRHLAVVGSRKATSYGERVVHQLVSPLARDGVVIVSGLAYGIDALAHRAAIEARGITIAVLGSGLDEDNIYPSQNRRLAEEITSSGGALISEFPLGTPPLKQHFPFRNRIIAGMCHGTLVIEAGEKSGSLITAQAALEDGRDVYAVPGPIDAPLSEGPHRLIKFGAIPVTSVTDIFPDDVRTLASPSYASKLPPLLLSDPHQQTIVTILSFEPLHVDEIIFKTNLPPEKVSEALTLLELSGTVRHLGGQHWTRA